MTAILRKLKREKWTHSDHRGHWINNRLFLSDFILAIAIDDPDYHGRATLLLPEIKKSLSSFGSTLLFQREDNRLARVCYYLGDYEQCSSLLFDTQSGKPDDFSFTFRPFQIDRFAQLEPKAQAIAAHQGLDYLFIEVLSPTSILSELGRLNFDPSPEYFRIVADLMMLAGDFEQLRRCATRYEEWGEQLPSDEFGFKQDSKADPLSWEASVAFLHGDFDKSIDLFEQSIAIQRGSSRRKKLAPRGLAGFFFQLALLARNKEGDLDRCEKLGKWGKDLAETNRSVLFDFGLSLTDCARGDVDQVAELFQYYQPRFLSYDRQSLHSLAFLLTGRLSRMSSEYFDPWIEKMDQFSIEAENEGFLWLASEAQEMANALRPRASQAKSDRAKKLRTGLRGDLGPPLSRLFQPLEEWEFHLKAIETAVQKHSKSQKQTGAKKRAARKELIWILNISGGSSDGFSTFFDLWAEMRTVSSKGRPSKGRAIDLKRLWENPDFEGLTDQDRKIVAQIKQARVGWRGSPFLYHFKDSRVLSDLAGHPLIFLPDDVGNPRPIKISTGRFQIDARKVSNEKEEGIEVTLKPSVEEALDKYGVLFQESPDEFTYYSITPEIADLAVALGNQEGVTLPSRARDRFFSAVTTFAEKIDITADGEFSSINATDASTEGPMVQVEGAPQPRLRLFPEGEGLYAKLIVQPVENCDYRFAPGEGRETIFAMVENNRIQARRDLIAETSLANQLLESSPTLSAKRGESPHPWTWQFPSPLEALQLLRDLAELPDQNSVIVEWPEEQPFKLHGSISSAQFNGNLGGSSEWLTVSGDVTINDDLVLSMRQLLDAALRKKHGFIELQNGEFVALGERFSQQLEDMAALARPGKAKTIKLPPLAALVLEDFVGDCGAKSKGKIWKESIARLKEAQDHCPGPPGNLEAELRPYQLDGYRWLSRLAKSGAGACLADDMGLGKTVQTLALLLERAAEGPALVVAPTSVAANWQDESLKFAPALNLHIFGNGDRKKQLAAAQPFDVVICTYGLLQRESEALSEVEWSTVVLDEAQAIKNNTTKRSKAARMLSADFRLVTTGTPVENRLSDLHTLFQFILPGYLGSWEKFKKTFADPIEKKQDSAARDRLRRLIQPFILRRLKSNVLRDLPSRTEVNIQVELGEKEKAFYEALRQRAVDELESDTSDEPGKKAFQILAELTRLRRACCHPALVDKKRAAAKLKSSKLETFTETISDLVAGNHKVLVFSQFVDHLALIRNQLDQMGVSYQYLDGSTAKPKRKAAVDAFQRGESDAFLISLKAGGFGLNLTAADYVIHMDPWWNPAAEDQASDRAHRIGQTRPVTIYRLITKDTIEEKIVELHHQKRELAESLLSDADVADAKLSPEELMKLLRERS